MASIEDLYAFFLTSSSVCIDTRKIQKGCIFFALRGANFNANEFAQKALEEGASLSVIDDKAYEGENTFLVDDVLTSLQKLAQHHRNQLGIPVIGLTGSNGKTTTKELINAVLSKKYRVKATAGNYNNHIGVPLTLLTIKPDTEVAIIEMGANHVGEIKFLCELAKPTHGLITNIGRAHLEGFGSVEGIKKGKGELYEYLDRNDGVIFVNKGIKELMELSVDKRNVVFYSDKETFFNLRKVDSTATLKVEDENGNLLTTHLVGDYNFHNVATAMCLGKYFKVDSTLVNEAVSAYMPDNNRSQIIEKGTNTILLDAYNANPSSVIAALESFANQDVSNKVVILGDMFELGQFSLEAHQEIVMLASKLGFQNAVFCGEEYNKVCLNHPNLLFFKEKVALETFLKEKKFENTFFLIKGSRGMSLETILPLI